MTKTEFQNLQFSSGMMFYANGQWSKLNGVDFEEEEIFDHDNMDFPIDIVDKVKDKNGKIIYDSEAG